MRFSSRNTKTLLYEEVVDDLYRIIDEKHIKPGEKLPAERELIEELGVSRNVLREAFHVLESRGIILSHQGKGRFLRQQPMIAENKTDDGVGKNLERCSMLEAYEVRQVLEEKAVELVVRNACEQDIAEIEKMYRRIQKTYEETGTTTGEFELHRLYAAKSGSMFMTQTLEIVLNAIYDMMYGKFSDILNSIPSEEELKSHRAIIDAIKKRDGEEAKKLIHLHLQDTIDILK